MWGNPVGEMMYEGLRYFAGNGTPTGAFTAVFGQGEESQLAGGGLPVATWDNPYTEPPGLLEAVRDGHQRHQPFIRYRSPAWHCVRLVQRRPDRPERRRRIAQQILIGDDRCGTQPYFIGESGGINDGAPTPKDGLEPSATSAACARGADQAGRLLLRERRLSTADHRPEQRQRRAEGQYLRRRARLAAAADRRFPSAAAQRQA